MHTRHWPAHSMPLRPSWRSLLFPTCYVPLACSKARHAPPPLHPLLAIPVTILLTDKLRAEAAAWTFARHDCDLHRTPNLHGSIRGPYGTCFTWLNSIRCPQRVLRPSEDMPSHLHENIALSPCRCSGSCQETREAAAGVIYMAADLTEHDISNPTINCFY